MSGDVLQAVRIAAAMLDNAHALVAMHLQLHVPQISQSIAINGEA